MRSVLVAALLLAASVSCALADDLLLTSEGTIGWDVPLVSLELEASFAVTYADDAFTASLALDLDEVGLTDLTSRATLAGQGWKLSAQVVIDVPSARISDGTLLVTAELGEATLNLGLVSEEVGVGLAAEFVLPDTTFLRKVVLGLNVDAYGRVQTENCELAFSYAVIEAGFACECADVTATATFTTDGFSELVLSAAGVGGLALGIECGAQVRYATSEKTLEMVPSFAAESPNCFNLYLGLVWDAPTKTLDGISVYGLGLACDIAGVRVRGLWELDPAAIALVKAPYWALLGLAWDVAAPCDQTGEASVAEASIAFFFGEQGLFDLGEILFGLEWPIAPGWTASLAVSLETSGGASVMLGWQTEL